MKRDFLLASILIAAIMVSCSKTTDVTVVQRPITDSTNHFYTGNRAPLEPSPFIKLPIGTIKPLGWLKKQLELQAAGFHGHLEEISSYLVKENNAWLSPEGEGEHGWEEVPYWLKGYSNCAYVLGNKEMIKEARIWLDAAINSQQEDGWFGPGEGRTGVASRLTGRADLWPNMIMLFNLQNYYEYSGDERVISLMDKYFSYLKKIPDNEFLVGFWPRMRAGDLLYSVYWLYNRTGEKWLLDFALKVHNNTADWDMEVASWHNVNIAQAFGEPVTYWQQSKNPWDLDAAEQNWQKVRQLFGQVPGGMFGGDENCRLGYDGPRQAIETCGIVEEMLSDEILLRISGNLKWANRCENVTFNTLPAAFTADMKALRYLTAPNMPQSDKGDKDPGLDNSGPMLWMNPHIHRCCQHNSGHGWPYFAENLVYATPDNGLAVVFYSACESTAKVGNGTEVTLTENTRYPFSQKIEFTINTPQSVQFPFYLRIPTWCDSPQLIVNGLKVNIIATPDSFLKIDRVFGNGDKISLELPMKITVTQWERNKNSVSVNYGPLTFSLKIEEKYVRDGGTEKWPAWDIYPASAWNYGLEINLEDPGQSFEVVKKSWPGSDMPFTLTGTPIEIRTKGRKIPQWHLDEKGLVGKIQESPVRTSEPDEPLTLVPMGAARIRISAFPIVAASENAREWKE